MSAAGSLAITVSDRVGGDDSPFVRAWSVRIGPARSRSHADRLVFAQTAYPGREDNPSNVAREVGSSSTRPSDGPPSGSRGLPMGFTVMVPATARAEARIGTPPG